MITYESSALCGDPIDKLMKLGLSEFEAKAFVTLLAKHPLGDRSLAELADIPFSMILSVVNKLISRGAAVRLQTPKSTQVTPVPADEFLNRYQHKHRDLIASLKLDLALLSPFPDPPPVFHRGFSDGLWLGRNVEMEPSRPWAIASPKTPVRAGP